MSTMNDTLQEEALFYPSDDTTTASKPKYRAKTAGDYLGHITDVRTTVTEWTDKKTGDNFSACIYNFKVHVAPENSSMTYTTTRDGRQETHDGEAYVGWTVIADGVFRFLEPKKDGTDTFVSNASTFLGALYPNERRKARFLCCSGSPRPCLRFLLKFSSKKLPEVLSV